jgi:hypothetical protein
MAHPPRSGRVQVQGHLWFASARRLRTANGSIGALLGRSPFPRCSWRASFWPLAAAFPCRSPKNRWPFQLVSVIALAILGEGAISLAVPGEAFFMDHHALGIPLPFANQERADFQSDPLPRLRIASVERSASAIVAFA